MTLILMIIIIKIFSGIFLCTLLGTILYLFWKAVGRLIEHKGYVDINYLIWKMVLLMFAIPITLIYANGFEKSTYVFEVTGPIKWVIGIVDEDGEETYIENGVNLVSVLKVKKDGRYRVFIENQGTKKAIAGGYYWVETEK